MPTDTCQKWGKPPRYLSVSCVRGKCNKTFNIVKSIYWRYISLFVLYIYYKLKFKLTFYKVIIKYSLSTTWAKPRAVFNAVHNKQEIIPCVEGATKPTQKNHVNSHKTDYVPQIYIVLRNFNITKLVQKLLELCQMVLFFILSKLHWEGSVITRATFFWFWIRIQGRSRHSVYMTATWGPFGIPQIWGLFSVPLFPNQFTMI